MLNILNVKANSAEPVDIYRIFQRLTMDVIAKAALGNIVNFPLAKIF